MYDKNKLNLDTDEIRLLNLPQLNFSNSPSKNSNRKIPPDTEQEIRNYFYSITDSSGKIDPQEFRNQLRRIGKINLLNN
jgi:hypothetical protein